MIVGPSTQANVIQKPDVSKHSLILGPKRHSIPTDYFSNIFEMSHMYSNYLKESLISWPSFLSGGFKTNMATWGGGHVPRAKEVEPEVMS